MNERTVHMLMLSFYFLWQEIGITSEHQFWATNWWSQLRKMTVWCPPFTRKSGFHRNRHHAKIAQFWSVHTTNVWKCVWSNSSFPLWLRNKEAWVTLGESFSDSVYRMKHPAVFSARKKKTRPAWFGQKNLRKHPFPQFCQPATNFLLFRFLSCDMRSYVNVWQMHVI